MFNIISKLNHPMDMPCSQATWKIQAKHDFITDLKNTLDRAFLEANVRKFEAKIRNVFNRKLKEDA